MQSIWIILESIQLDLDFNVVFNELPSSWILWDMYETHNELD
jgi:hypothetical protein